MDRRTASLRARLGSRLRALRRARQMSQEQLAAKAGMSYKFIGEIERGVGNPTVDTLAAVSHALDVDVQELFGVAPGRQPVSQVLTVSRQDWEQARAASEVLSRVLGRRDGSTRGGRPRK